MLYQNVTIRKKSIVLNLKLQKRHENSKLLVYVCVSRMITKTRVAKKITQRKIIKYSLTRNMSYSVS